MFLTLFKKECSCYLKSVTYFIYLAAVILFYLSQMGEMIVPVEKPQPGYEDYGECRTTDKDLIMQNTLVELLWEYTAEEYVTYPVGFYKSVRLNDKEQEKVKKILLDMTTLDEKNLEDFCNGNDDVVREIYSAFKPEQNLSWEEFSAGMEELDDMLGGGSKYSKDSIKYTEVPQTYEQALAAYESLLKDDRVTNAYARLFCDYMGIILTILPVFLAVTRVLKDRKAQADQVIFMAKAHSAKIVFTRYLSAVFVIIIPVLLLGFMSLMQAVYFAKGIHSEYDIFAYVKYTGFWLLPGILVCLSTGFFLTELTDSAIAVFVQGIWWFVSIFTSSMDLVGGAGWNLIPRFNTVGEFAVYEQMKEQLVKNRLCYTGLALILIFGTIVIYSRKRKGEFVSAGTKLRNRKNKLEV